MRQAVERLRAYIGWRIIVSRAGQEWFSMARHYRSIPSWNGDQPEMVCFCRAVAAYELYFGQRGVNRYQAAAVLLHLLYRFPGYVISHQPAETVATARCVGWLDEQYRPIS